MKIPKAEQFPNVANSHQCPACGAYKVLGNVLCVECTTGFRQLDLPNTNLMAMVRRAETAPRS